MIITILKIAVIIKVNLPLINLKLSEKYKTSKLR